MKLKKIIATQFLKNILSGTDGLVSISSNEKVTSPAVLELVSKMNDVVATVLKTPSEKVTFLSETLKKIPPPIRAAFRSCLKENTGLKPLLETCDKIDKNPIYALYHDIISNLEKESCTDTRFITFKTTLESLDPSHQYIQVCSILRTHTLAYELLRKIEAMTDNPVSQFAKNIVERLMDNPDSFFETLIKNTKTLPPALMTIIKPYLIEKETIKKFLTLLQPTEKFKSDDPAANYALPIIMGVILESGSRYEFQELRDGLSQVPDDLYDQIISYLKSDPHTKHLVVREEKEKTSRVSAKQRARNMKKLKQDYEIRVGKAAIASTPSQVGPMAAPPKRTAHPAPAATSSRNVGSTNLRPDPPKKEKSLCVVS
ncbi:hypothetical protein HOG98_06640 [bacterium]|jgi:hypothetical protein|nr:hypothetical protein [bacterium]